MDARLEYLYDQIDEELNDAYGYIKKAMKCKDHLEMANALVRLSGEELQHAQVLIAIAEQDVAALEKSGAQEVVGLHKWLHKRFAERIEHVKHLHDEYHRS